MFLVCKIAAASQRPTLLNWRSKQHSLEVFVFKLMTKSLFEGGFLCIHFKCILHYYQHRKRCLLQVNTSKVICFLNGCVFLYQLNTEGFFVRAESATTDWSEGPVTKLSSWCLYLWGCCCRTFILSPWRCSEVWEWRLVLMVSKLFEIKHKLVLMITQLCSQSLSLRMFDYSVLFFKHTCRKEEVMKLCGKK